MTPAVFISSYSNSLRYDCSQIEHVHPIFCAHLIILLQVLNLGIITSTPPLECLHCLFVCNSNIFHSFIFKLCIMIVHTLKMCTDDAGPEQSLVLYIKRICLVYMNMNMFSRFDEIPAMNLHSRC